MKNKSRSFLLAFALCIAIASTAAVLVSFQTSAAPAQGILWQDDFTDPVLDPAWSWINEDPTNWSLSARPGFLRITTTQVISPVKNILVVKAPPGNYEIQTRLFFTPTVNFQTAGLLVYQDDNNFLVAGRAFCNIPLYCIGNGIYFEYVQNGAPAGNNYKLSLTSQSEAYLKIIRSGNGYTAYASEDGVTWTILGTLNIAIKPTKVGLVTNNLFPGVPEIPADFDYFRLEDQSFRLHLPVIMRGSPPQ